MAAPLSPTTANLAGALALLLWSATALFLSYCSAMPPFLLTAVTLFIGFFTFAAVWIYKGESVFAHFKFPPKIIFLAVAGVGIYRLLYFAAMHHVPAVEASLINYLWPVLIVLFTHFLPDEKIEWFHIVGAIIGFAGVCILLSPGMRLLTEFSFGHVLAVLAAFTWSIYSVVSRTTKEFSSMVVPIAFLYSGIVFFIISVFFEDWAGHFSVDYIPFIFALGIVSGVGYFLWDVGMKHGNIQLLSVGSFFVPLVSTFLLILFDRAEAETHILLATGLITGAALLASQDRIRKNLKSMRS